MEIAHMNRTGFLNQAKEMGLVPIYACKFLDCGGETHGKEHAKLRTEKNMPGDQTQDLPVTYCFKCCML